jgi:hypothetical protein
MALCLVPRDPTNNTHSIVTKEKRERLSEETDTTQELEREVELEKEIARLRAENEKRKPRNGTVKLKVSQKGAIS